MPTSQANYLESTFDVTAATLELAMHVESMLGDTLRAIQFSDPTLLKVIEKRDLEANALHHGIETQAVDTLATSLSSPVNVRQTLASVKIATDLERIGDLIEHIARNISKTPNNYAQNDVDYAYGLNRLGRHVRQQLSDIISAYSDEDALKAVQVWLSGQDLDALYETVFNDLVLAISAAPHASDTQKTLIKTAKNLERIGARVTSMAESVYLMVRGEFLIDDKSVMKQTPNAQV